ncbi:MAG: glycosyltransferase family 39 protein [bacterium]|nr:glycosyltransferase family 39 protein [bacterium]
MRFEIKATLTRVFWAVFFITTLLRLIYAVSLPLSGDEAYFWEWARHPALCYYDHPPVAGWILWVTRHLFGDTVLAVRIVAVMTGSLVTAVVYRYTLDITGLARSAAWTGLLAMGIPVLAGLGVLYTTDTPVLAAGTLGGYLFHRAVNRGDRKSWPLAGLCFAVLYGSKFLGVPIIAASFLYLIARPDKRPLLKTPGPYTAWGLSLLGLIPVLIWNAQNGWATFIFNFGSRHASSSLSPGNVFDYLVGQAAGLSPLLLVIGIPVLARAGFPWRERDGDRATAGFLALVPLGGFLALSLATKVGIHWPAVGVPFLAVSVGAALTADRKPGRWFFGTLALAWIMTALLFAVPLAAKLLPADWEYPRAERINTGQLRKMVDDPGQVGAQIDAELAALKGEKDAFAFTRSYALSSLAAFYIPSHPQVTVLGEGSVHGRNHRYWFDPARHVGLNALYVSYRPAEKEVPFVERFFERSEVVSDSAGSGEIPLTVIRGYGYNGTR